MYNHPLGIFLHKTRYSFSSAMLLTQRCVFLKNQMTDASLIK